MPHSTDNTPARGVWTSDDGTMAYDTARNRWPKIVQGMVDDFAQAASTCDGTALVEAREIQVALKSIKHEIINNKALKPLQPDGVGDVVKFNVEIEQTERGYTWQDCPWLFGECYLYRRVQSLFARSTDWNSFDVFKGQKDSTFVKSRAAVEELAKRYLEMMQNLEQASEEALRLIFVEMTQVALWGNATDLSLLSNLSLDQVQKLQGREAIERSQRNIVDNDTEEVWGYLTDPHRSNRRIDIVLDNAGFELFTDLVYTAYLLESGLASKIKLHVKDFPWFVSDATPSDISSMFEHLCSVDMFPNRQALDILVPKLRGLFECGAITIGQHGFWTTAASFHEMEIDATGLFKCFQGSSLVIFKGDLNYRKLVRDALWQPTTGFKTAIGPLGQTSGIKVLALRTNKADSCVGIENAARVEELDREAPGRQWVRNGKYAVISFSDGR
ncbi:DUF89 domain protein [Clohesyomyces aquaticus]|uniref:Sugar phosphate phosphatase n=1 Tax=Clohesyomyces aquaticus TaxID=1231657 RepID=A0A1Y1YYM2_9PLEO|nr:DUF89 domain protein [Clohesyomyces aquaticus]